MSYFDKLARLVETNGIREVGLAALAEKALEEKYWTRVPRSWLQDFKETTENNIISDVKDDRKTNKFPANFVVTASYDIKTTKVVRDKDGKEVKAASPWATLQGSELEEKLHIQGVRMRSIEIGKIDAGLITDLIRANLQVVQDISNNIIIQKFAMAVIFVQMTEGLISPYSDGEYIIVDTPTKSTDDADIKEFMDNLPIDMAELACYASGLNHYMINHTTGSGKLQGIMRKVYLATGRFGQDVVEEKEEKKVMRKTMITADETRMVYRILHRIDKRNASFCILEQKRDQSAAWPACLPRPMRINKDRFLELRSIGLPAGQHKPVVTLEVLKRMAKNNLLAVSPALSLYKEVVDHVKEARQYSVSAHVGASYYNRGTPIPHFRNDQNEQKLEECKIICGIYVKIIAPSSTLAASPAFNNVIENYGDEYKDWTALCKGLAELSEVKTTPEVVKRIVSTIKTTTTARTLKEAINTFNMATTDTMKDVAFEAVNRENIKLNEDAYHLLSLA